MFINLQEPEIVEILIREKKMSPFYNKDHFIDVC